MQCLNPYEMTKDSPDFTVTCGISMSSIYLFCLTEVNHSNVGVNKTMKATSIINKILS